MLAELTAEILDRPRVVVNEAHPTLFLPAWTAREAPARTLICGTGRYIDVTHGPAEAPVILPGTDPATWRAEELARPWLRRVWAAHRPDHRRRCRCMACHRVPWSRATYRSHLATLPPRWFSGDGAEGEWAYVDLVSAYPSIYGPLGLSVSWQPDDTLPRLGVAGWDFLGLDELAPIKDTQRAVGGILRSVQMTKLVRGRPVTESTLGWSRFLAPDLWAVVMATLHAVAAEGVRAGAVMWDTDGGVVPVDAAPALIHRLWETWGLCLTVRTAGRGRVWGVKHWQIGAEATRQRGTRRLLAHDHRISEPSPAELACLRRVRMARL